MAEIDLYELLDLDPPDPIAAVIRRPGLACSNYPHDKGTHLILPVVL